MTNTKKSNLSGIIFLVAIAVITVILVVFVFISVGKPFVIKEFSDIKEVTIDNYKTVKKDSEYYVLVYNNDENKDKLIEEVVMAYANYARTTSDAKQIYVLNYQTNKEITNSENLNINSSSLDSKLPTLVLIKNGSVSSSDTKNTISTINQALTSAMNE